MPGNLNLQLLRLKSQSDNGRPKTNSLEILKKGQPLYDPFNNKLYISKDGETEYEDLTPLVGEELISPDGTVQLKIDNNKIEYKAKWNEDSTLTLMSFDKFGSLQIGQSNLPTSTTWYGEITFEGNNFIVNSESTFDANSTFKGGLIVRDPVNPNNNDYNILYNTYISDSSGTPKMGIVIPLLQSNEIKLNSAYLKKEDFKPYPTTQPTYSISVLNVSVPIYSDIIIKENIGNTGAVLVSDTTPNGDKKIKKSSIRLTDDNNVIELKSGDGSHPLQINASKILSVNANISSLRVSNLEADTIDVKTINIITT